MTEHDNPILNAEKWGESIGGHLISKAIAEMELTFASTILPKFKDNPMIRTRQHLLLHWNMGYLKSSSINEFLKVIPKSISIADITSTSPQMLLGSISENKNQIIKPIFAGIEFAIITELLSFLGQGPNQREKVDVLNKIMENEPITRHLLKLAQYNFSETEIAKLEAENINYNPRRGELSYRPDVVIISASRPLPNKTYTYLRWSGHLYRYHILQHRVSDKEAKHFFRQNFCPDDTLKEKLKQFNERLTAVKIKEMNVPSSRILSGILDPLEELVKDETRGRRIKLATIIDVRTKGDIIRELASHALIRTASQNEFRDIDKLEYTNEDVEFLLKDVGHFVESKIDPLFVEDFSTRITKKRPRHQVKENVLELLKDGKVASRSVIDKYILSKTLISKATISNALADLLDSDQIQQPKFGFYKLTEDGKK